METTNFLLLEGILKKLRKLSDKSEISVKMKLSKLNSELSILKEKKENIEEELLKSEAVSHKMSWVPIVGNDYKRKNDENKKISKLILKEWKDIELRYKIENSKIDDYNFILETLDNIKKTYLNKKKPSNLAKKELLMFSNRVKFLSESDGNNSEKIEKIFLKIKKMVQSLESMLLDWNSGNNLIITNLNNEKIQNEKINSHHLNIDKNTHFSIENFKNTAQELQQKEALEDLKNISNKTKSNKLDKNLQLDLNFEHEENVHLENKIYLPVSTLKNKEYISLGAFLDKEGNKKTNRLWIKKSDKSKFETSLPYCYKKNNIKLSYPPMRHNTPDQSLWCIFTSSTWTQIRNNFLEKTGNRCQLCGKQGGKFWSTTTPEEEKIRSGVVDFHEIWDWKIIDQEKNIGIQKLKKVLIVCKDCHFIFHEAIALWKAKKFNLEDEVKDYINKTRLLINKCSQEDLDNQIILDSKDYNDIQKTKKWIIDLSYLKNKMYLKDIKYIIKANNKANISTKQIYGLPFYNEDDILFPEKTIKNLLKEF
jgi:hypothetical protein